MSVMGTEMDSVLIAPGQAGPAVRTMLDEVHTRWPNMVAMLDDDFHPWPEVRDLLPPDHGEVYLARDPAMEREWDDTGYILMAGGEGPFAILYRPAGDPPTIQVRLNENPYPPSPGFRYDPYPATLVTPGLSLITIVTPDEESPFSQRLINSLTHALTTTY
jgi:hypothetical protein